MQRPWKQLKKEYFCKVWKFKLPYFKIHKAGSAFCDTCSKLKNVFEKMKDGPGRQLIWDTSVAHRSEAASEF